MILRRRAALKCPTFPVKPREFEAERYAKPRFWIAARYTEHYGYFRKRFLKACLLKKGYLRHYTVIQSIWHLLITKVYLELPWDRVKDWEENRRVQENRLLCVPGIMRPGILCMILTELILKIVWWKLRGMLSRSCISVNSQTQITPSVGETTSRPRSVWAHSTLNSQCRGSLKWRWQDQ